MKAMKGGGNKVQNAKSRPYRGGARKQPGNSFFSGAGVEQQRRAKPAEKTKGEIREGG